MLEKLAPGGHLIGLDVDLEAIERTRKLLEGPARRLGVKLTILHTNFAALGDVLIEEAIGGADALLADLGISSFQLGSAARGFSFEQEAPLDMRMDASSPDRTARDLVNRLPEPKLADLIFELGGERLSRRIARAIVAERRVKPIETTTELARIVVRAYGRHAAGRWRIHPATRTFMALRIAVNRELESLQSLLAQLPERINPGGRVVIISFHSLEDRLVKGAFRELAQRDVSSRLPTFRVLTPKPVRPTADEAQANPKARSARLRAAERLSQEEPE
jgi:16S rRNA (cytosine1402-N4)-methyltransferase